MTDQLIVAGVLVVTLALFVWGRWRYDLVAMMALLSLTVIGIVPPGEAYLGFGHPAVITVAAVLVVSRGLLNAGPIDAVAAWLSHLGDRPTLQVIGLTVPVAFCSAFINNVGALAILMPVAIRMARSSGNPPSVLLMPLAFGSLLGGMTTLIGTPPNIIIATFRAEVNASPFNMFDFTPVGAGVALAGVAFIVLGGWRLIPQRKGQASREDLFRIEEYIAELRVQKDSKLVGRPVREIDEAVDAEIVVVGLVRGKRRMPAPGEFEILREGDILTVETDPEALKSLADAAGLELLGSYQFKDDDLRSKEISVIEAVVMPDSLVVGRAVRDLRLGWRFGINVLAVARQGSRVRGRLRQVKLRSGDILLLQAHDPTLQEALETLNWLPLAERGLRVGQPRRILLSIGIFGTALGLVVGGVLPVQVALSVAAVGMILFGLVTLKELYQQIDWPVIVLLGAMIPVGKAFETTGGAATAARTVLDWSPWLSPMLTVGLLLVATMFLSDVINNAAAAVLMAPIALSVADGMGASSDPFLMAVAVGSSCAFLTPIGHQSNTLVMGPGGYQFGDYWRLGLPLEMIVVVVGLPLLVTVWPLFP